MSAEGEAQQNGTVNGRMPALQPEVSVFDNALSLTGRAASPPDFAGRMPPTHGESEVAQSQPGQVTARKAKITSRIGQLYNRRHREQPPDSANKRAAIPSPNTSQSEQAGTASEFGPGVPRARPSDLNKTADWEMQHSAGSVHQVFPAFDERGARLDATFSQKVSSSQITKELTRPVSDAPFVTAQTPVAPTQNPVPSVPSHPHMSATPTPTKASMQIPVAPASNQLPLAPVSLSHSHNQVPVTPVTSLLPVTSAPPTSTPLLPEPQTPPASGIWHSGDADSANQEAYVTIDTKPEPPNSAAKSPVENGLEAIVSQNWATAPESSIGKEVSDSRLEEAETNTSNAEPDLNTQPLALAETTPNTTESKSAGTVEPALSSSEPRVPKGFTCIGDAPDKPEADACVIVTEAMIEPCPSHLKSPSREDEERERLTRHPEEDPHWEGDDTSQPEGTIDQWGLILGGGSKQDSEETQKNCLQKPRKSSSESGSGRNSGRKRPRKGKHKRKKRRSESSHNSRNQLRNKKNGNSTEIAGAGQQNNELDDDELSWIKKQKERQDILNCLRHRNWKDDHVNLTPLSTKSGSQDEGATRRRESLEKVLISRPKGQCRTKAMMLRLQQSKSLESLSSSVPLWEGSPSSEANPSGSDWTPKVHVRPFTQPIEEKRPQGKARATKMCDTWAQDAPPNKKVKKDPAHSRSDGDYEMLRAKERGPPFDAEFGDEGERVSVAKSKAYQDFVEGLYETTSKAKSKNPASNGASGTSKRRREKDSDSLYSCTSTSSSSLANSPQRKSTRKRIPKYYGPDMFLIDEGNLWSSDPGNSKNKDISASLKKRPKSTDPVRTKCRDYSFNFLHYKGENSSDRKTKPKKSRNGKRAFTIMSPRKNTSAYRLKRVEVRLQKLNIDELKRRMSPSKKAERSLFGQFMFNQGSSSSQSRGWRNSTGSEEDGSSSSSAQSSPSTETKPVDDERFLPSARCWRQSILDPELPKDPIIIDDDDCSKDSPGETTEQGPETRKSIHHSDQKEVNSLSPLWPIAQISSGIAIDLTSSDDEKSADCEENETKDAGHVSDEDNEPMKENESSLMKELRKDNEAVGRKQTKNIGDGERSRAGLSKRPALYRRRRNLVPAYASDSESESDLLTDKSEDEEQTHEGKPSPNRTQGPEERQGVSPDREKDSAIRPTHASGDGSCEDGGTFPTERSDNVPQDAEAEATTGSNEHSKVGNAVCSTEKETCNKKSIAHSRTRTDSNSDLEIGRRDSAESAGLSPMENSAGVNGENESRDACEDGTEDEIIRINISASTLAFAEDDEQNKKGRDTQAFGSDEFADDDDEKESDCEITKTEDVPREKSCFARSLAAWNLSEHQTFDKALDLCLRGRIPADGKRKDREADQCESDEESLNLQLEDDVDDAAIAEALKDPAAKRQENDSPARSRKQSSSDSEGDAAAAEEPERQQSSDDDCILSRVELDSGDEPESQPVSGFLACVCVCEASQKSQTQFASVHHRFLLLLPHRNFAPAILLLCFQAMYPKAELSFVATTFAVVVILCETPRLSE